MTITIIGKTNAKQLNALVATKTQLNEGTVRTIIDATWATIREELLLGNKVIARGFGTFEMIERAEKRAYNVYSKQVEINPPSKYVKFRYTKNKNPKYSIFPEDATDNEDNVDDNQIPSPTF